MNDINFEELSPNIRNAVKFISDNGFKTIDSGDGSNYQNGMECAIPEPMVAIIVDSEKMISESHRLADILAKYNIPKSSIQATYSPDDCLCIITIIHDNLINVK